LQWIVVWGLGVLSGSSKKEVSAFFEPQPIEIRFFVNQNYCFCKFKCVSHAIEAKQSKDGHQYSEQQTIYIGYTSSGEYRMTS